MKRERTPEEDREFSAWIARARNAPIARTLEALGGRALSDDRGGPCPRPGCINGPRATSDRFSINRRKNLFFCRATQAGGSPIDLVRHVRDMPFMEAVEFVTNEKPPIASRVETAEERIAREKRLEQEERAAEQRARDAAVDSARFREQHREMGFKIWRKAKPIAGTLAQDYLALRKLRAPIEASLRFDPDAPFFDQAEGRVLFRGPAMVAAMVRRDPDSGRDKFSCAHRTWIDLADPKGKKRVVDQKTGEIVSAKRMLGSKKGAYILLARKPNARGEIIRVFTSEGIENGLAVWCELDEMNSPLLDGAEFRAAGDLGNLSGVSAGSIAHPTDTFTDARGALRKKRVPGPVPRDPDPDPVIALPDGCEEEWLIGDGSSEPFFTRCALERAAARRARVDPDVVVRLIMANSGVDMDDMRMMKEGAAA